MSSTPGSPRVGRRVSLAAASSAVAAVDPVLARLVREAGPIRHRPRDPDGPFGALVRAITYQQLAGPAAQAIHGRFHALVDGPFTPESVAGLSDEALRAAGLSAAKVRSVRDLAAKVLDGTVPLRGAVGIGRWTAEMYLMFELRRMDVWPVDDLGVRQGYGIAWSIDPPPTQKQLEPLGDRFRPYRSVVARYCWAAVQLRGGTGAAQR